MGLESIYRPVEDTLEQVRRELRRQAEGLAEHYGALAENHTYLKDMVDHLSDQGKLLRPALVVLSSRSAGAGADEPGVVQTAAAVELVHSASLVHDDIIDGADYRARAGRSQVAFHRRFGTHAAVLVGDILYAQFFSLLTALEVSAPRRITLLGRFCATTKRMCQCELFQQGVQGYDVEPRESEYLQIIEGKTAALMSACCHAGAVLAGQDEADQLYSDFGLYFGLAFQLIDDYLDGDVAYVSRPTLKQRAQQNGGRARDLVEAMPQNAFTDALSQLLDYVLQRPATEPVQPGAVSR